jgi:hypothetical protein
MTPYFDIVDRKWRFQEFEDTAAFSTEEDAKEAMEFAVRFAALEIARDKRYRRAAERAKA